MKGKKESEFTTIRVLKTSLLNFGERNAEHISQIKKFAPHYKTFDIMCNRPLTLTEEEKNLPIN